LQITSGDLAPLFHFQRRALSYLVLLFVCREFTATAMLHHVT
jgi:hypothetical protein